MNFLSRIPIWGWYLFSVAYCYMIWNPYFSIYQTVVSPNVILPVKAIAVVLVLCIAALYVTEGHKSLNTFVIVLFLAFFGCLFWFASSMGFDQYQSIDWWGQWIVGLFLTIALQGGRIYRSLTGRVPVGSDIVENVDHHG
jgi:hypothetical protein